MSEHQSEEQPTVSRALYQLNFYLKILDLPFTVKDLYHDAYLNETKNENYDHTTWLEFTDDDAKYSEALAEPFTTHTIIETLLQAGHDRLVKLLMKRVRDYGIGFAQAYVLGISRWK